jgi:hypothetical protein
MRKLKQYSSMSCLVTGFLERWENPAGDKVRILITTCSVEGLSGWIHKEDHLWFFMAKEAFEDAKRSFEWTRLSKVSFAGSVQGYRRSDGTSDVGVVHDPSLIRWSTFEGIVMPEMVSKRQWKNLLNHLNSGLIYNDYEGLSRSDFLAIIDRTRQLAIRNIGSPPKPIAEKMPHKSLGHQNREPRAIGFSGPKSPKRK